MKPKISKAQLAAIKTLISSLQKYQQKGFGKISNTVFMYNFQLPDSILVKYENEFHEGGERKYKFVIASVKRDGLIDYIDDQFKTIFERHSFLSECHTFDIQDASEYEKIE